jgi:hypothetical protein
MLMLSVCVVELLYVRNSVSSVSAVEATASLGVYWDARCTDSVLSIYWGVLYPGQTADVVVYVRNEGDQSILLNVTPTNYCPADASSYLKFTWTCGNKTVAPGEAVRVTTSLFVSPLTMGNFTFGFDMIFGKGILLGDLNGDGIVDMFDAILFAKAMGSTPRSPNWNPNADFDGDGVVDITDAIIFASNFGQHM